MAERSGAQTFERGLDILWHFIESPNGTSTMNEVVAQFGMSRSTAYRLVKVLKDRGFLEEADADGAYRIGIRVLHLAHGSAIHEILRQVVLPFMMQLVAATQETAILTVKYGDHALCVERVRSPQSINFTFESNRLMPLHAGASAKILLAYSSPLEQQQVMDRPFIRYTPTTPADPEWLRRDLDEIRRNGYAITHSEIDPDSTSISVPILSASGRLIAGLSIGGPSFRMTEVKQHDILNQLRRVASDVANRLPADRRERREPVVARAS